MNTEYLFLNVEKLLNTNAKHQKILKKEGLLTNKSIQI